MDHSSPAYVYEPDVTVEEQETPVIPIRPRTSTEDLTMQVRLEDHGNWHRKMADLDETACERPFHLRDANTRREQLTQRDGLLCTSCFTPRERRRANENDRRADLEADARAQREHIDRLFRNLNEE